MFSRASVVGLSACAVQPQWYDYIGRYVGLGLLQGRRDGAACSPQAEEGPSSCTSRPGRGKVCRPGRAIARARAWVKGNKVTVWSQETGTAIWDLRTGTGVRLSVGATRVSINSVLPLHTQEHALQSL